jgi:4-hydroxybenzoate polyprenyltransferase
MNRTEKAVPIAAGRSSTARSLLTTVVRSLRPHQWTKNLFVFAGVIFSHNLLTPLAFTATAAFVIFCGLSGAMYLLNDIADYEKDRIHPRKQHRPIASGRLSRQKALVVVVVLLAVTLGSAFLLSWKFGWVSVAYVSLLTLYSGWLKHLVIVDVLTVAIGFVLRAVAGAVVIDVEISPWLLICTILLALFLALGRRRHELLLLEAEAENHRPTLSEYSPAFLDQMVGVVTASTVTAYALYTMSPETSEKFHTRWLPVTLPFVLYGVFRYLYLLYHRQLGGNPSELFLTDRPLLLNTLLWILTVVLLIYGPRWFE